MAELRVLRSWSEPEIEARLSAARLLRQSFDPSYAHPDTEWHSERAVAAIGAEPAGPPGAAFARAKRSITDYRFSDRRIVRGHFDPASPLLGRRMLLEIRVLGLRYLCGTVVTEVRDERTGDASTFGFRYDTLEGHIERGFEWFLLEKDHSSGVLRFCIESQWQAGDFPNRWSRAGFTLLSGHYRARWIASARAHLRRVVERDPST